MRAYDAVITERKRQRRIARRIEALVVLIVTAACVLVITSDAGAYVHVNACKSSLRGGGGTDNDVRNAVVSSHASGFVGWASGYTRTGANSVYVRGLLTYPGGRYLYWTGHCWSHDFGPDWFL